MTDQAGSTQETTSGQSPTIEDQIKNINTMVANLKKDVDANTGDEGAGLAELTARVDAIEKDFAAFKQQLHDAGIRLVS